MNPLDICLQLTRQGHKVTNITGDMEKRDRDNIVDEFRTGKTKILIATDLLARGFDVRSVRVMPLVVRVELESTPKSARRSHCTVCVNALKRPFTVMLLGKQASCHGHTSCR